MRNKNLYLIEVMRRKIYNFDDYREEFNNRKTLISLDSNCCTDLLCKYWSSKFARLHGYEMTANYAALEGNSSSFDDEIKKYIHYSYITKDRLVNYGYKFQRHEFTKSFLDAFNHPSKDIHNSGIQFLKKIYEMKDANLRKIIELFLSFGPISKQHLINPFLVHTALFYAYRNKRDINNTPATFLKQQQYDSAEQKKKLKIAYNVYMDCYIIFHTLHLPSEIKEAIITMLGRAEPYIAVPLATFDKGMMLFAKAFFIIYEVFNNNFNNIKNDPKPNFKKDEILNKLSQEDIAVIRKECYPDADDNCIKEIAYELLVNRLIF